MKTFFPSTLSILPLLSLVADRIKEEVADGIGSALLDWMVNLFTSPGERRLVEGLLQDLLLQVNSIQSLLGSNSSVSTIM